MSASVKDPKHDNSIPQTSAKTPSRAAGPPAPSSSSASTSTLPALREIQLQEALQELKNKYSQLYNYANNLRTNCLQQEKTIKLHDDSVLQKENLFRDQIKELSRKLEHLQNERRKDELNLEILKSKLIHSQSREQSHCQNLARLESQDKHTTEKVDTDRRTIEQLTKELEQVKKELAQAKASWARVDAMYRKAQASLTQTNGSREKVAELTELLSSERNRYLMLQETLVKERRDKQIALKCLHDAEIKLEQALYEGQSMKKQLEPQPPRSPLPSQSTPTPPPFRNPHPNADATHQATYEAPREVTHKNTNDASYDAPYDAPYAPEYVPPLRNTAILDLSLK